MFVRRRATAAALATVCALSLLAACGDKDGDKADADPSSSQSASQSTGGTPSESGDAIPVADPEHAVDQPGPLKESLEIADILVYSTKPLSDEIIDRIKKVKGVEVTEQFSLASVPIENRVVTLAAVDPATFRRFTVSGKQEEIWGRVAGGELATKQATGKRIQDKQAFVRLGADKDAPSVHVGAYADPPYGVDLVVNQKWGEELKMVEGNAMVIATGSASPQSVRKPLKKIIGDADVSIQMLDVVAREGLDPNARQTAVPTGTSVGAAVGVYNYRVVGGRVIPDAGWVAANIRTEDVPILGKVTCHKAMLVQLRAALTEVVEQGLGSKVYQTAGCFYPRFIAGTTSLSNHAFGMAIDINSAENGRGTVGQMDPEVVRIFKKWGFGWGGDWNYTDPMHFELAQIVDVQ
ncbi:M15 family metallopeptidase [Nocardioides jensenii]|uniref:M15 family metallopeptidase n=1 Tax=Nocardioides jensenii TaxID=1843 RepID=UPI0008358A13|nr:M15 family metallopeptidase [Nocardioides jensenii]